jgi:putative salt-induced outer membrane protein YdiY
MKPSLIPSRLLRACLAISIFLLAGFPSVSFGKRKDDVVVMKNGDRFTGEIKGLQQGELIFKSDYMKESVRLDWKEIEHIESKDNYVVELKNGQRVTGTIKKASEFDPSGNDFKIASRVSVMRVKQSDVITIQQQEESFWNQLTGSINYGFSFTSASSATSSTLGADVAYRTSKNVLQLGTSSQFSSQSGSSDANRFTFDSYFGRALTQHWTAAGLLNLLKSNQQDLNLRSTYGGALVRRLFQSDRTSLQVLAGLVDNHEQYAPQPGTKPAHNNAEALTGVRFLVFHFKTLNINSQTFLFPGLSDAGRLRLSSQSNLRIELARNFYWNFQLYENYDSQPPVIAPKNDLGTTMSLAWTF